MDDMEVLGFGTGVLRVTSSGVEHSLVTKAHREKVLYKMVRLENITGLMQNTVLDQIKTLKYTKINHRSVGQVCDQRMFYPLLQFFVLLFSSTIRNKNFVIRSS